MARGILIPILLLTTLLPHPATAEDFEFQQLNRAYSYPTADLIPIQQGPMSVRLGSPENTLTLRRHQVKLRPAPGGGHLIELSVLFDGQGQLEADLSLAGAVQRLKDEVTLPRQSLNLTGHVLLAQGPDGYWIQPKKLDPPSIQVRIQSRLSADLVQTCRKLAFLAPATACDGLEQGLSQVTMAIPNGEVFLLPYAWLTAPERSRLDAYLDRAAGK